MKRILTLLLALSMLLPILASCGDDTAETGGGEVIGGEGWWNDADFKGAELSVIYPPDGVFEGQCYIRSKDYQTGPEQIGADEVKNLCYNRNRNVATTLNLNVTYIEAEGTNMVLDEWTKMAKGAPDIAYLPTNKLNNNLLGGYLYNVHSDDDTNYFDFTHPCWYNDFMDTFTIDKAKHYGVAGDYFLSVMQAANAIFMNTDYYDTYVASYLYSLDSFVEMVEGRAWTNDEFIDIINRGWNQTSTSAKITKDDGIGLIAHTSTWLYPFIYSVDNYVFRKDVNGELQMVETSTDLYNIIAEVMKIYGADGTLSNEYSYQSAADASAYIDLFTVGNSLFIEGLAVGDLEDKRLLGMEKKIAIPYPLLLPELQSEYRTYVGMQAQLGGILKNTHNFSASTAYLELLNEQSIDVVNEYFQYTLKFKYSTDATGVNMLDIIHNTIGSSFNKIQSDNVQSYSGQSERIIYIVVNSVSAGTNQGITAYESIRDAYKTGLTKLKALFAELD